MSAPHANQNARKEPGEKPGSFLHIRCFHWKKSNWVRAAQCAGMGLSEWVTRSLDAAAGGGQRE